MKIFYSFKESIFSFFRSISVSMFPHFLTKNSSISSIPLFLLIRFFCALVEKDSKLSNFQRNPNGRTKEKKRRKETRTYPFINRYFTAKRSLLGRKFSSSMLSTKRLLHQMELPLHAMRRQKYETFRLAKIEPKHVSLLSVFSGLSMR